MPLTGVLDSQELRHSIRDLVALSTLPAIWKAYDPQQIADSVAAALLTMLDSEIVCVSLPRERKESGIEITRTGGISAESDSAIRAALRGWLRNGPSNQAASVVPLGESTLFLACSPIGFGSNAILVAGSRRSDFPSEAQRLLLGVAANEATIALQRWHAETDQRRFVALVENSSDFIGVAGLDGVPQYINAAGLRLVGLGGLADAARLHVLDFLMPKEVALVRDELWPRVMRDGRWVGELDFRHFKTGGAIPFLVDWFRIDDPRRGCPINVATVSRDLTAQKRAEGEMLHLNDTLEHRVADRTSELAEAHRKLIREGRDRELADARLQEARQELFHAARLSAAGQMAAALAHELSQPLTAAANSVAAARRLLAKGGEEIVTASEVMGEAGEQILRAGQIMRRLREFVSRGETDKRVELVSTMVEEARALALRGPDALDVQVRLHFEPNARHVLVDRIQIQQVLVNLMRNAIEAMDASRRRELDVATSLRDERMVEIAVTDTGPGLPDDIAARLFEPFVSTKPNGMGLGLSICRSIVEVHGGRLHCETNTGGGTVFRFTVPVAPTNGTPNAG
jgi:two-component system, LuxR family, sensor kinase FixL